MARELVHEHLGDGAVAHTDVPVTVPIERMMRHGLPLPALGRVYAPHEPHGRQSASANFARPGGNHKDDPSAIEHLENEHDL